MTCLCCVFHNSRRLQQFYYSTVLQFSCLYLNEKPCAITLMLEIFLTSIQKQRFFKSVTKMLSFAGLNDIEISIMKEEYN